MITPNALSLDFWINELFYYDLYEIDCTSKIIVYENYNSTEEVNNVSG
jgi:hypothetical protein